MAITHHGIELDLENNIYWLQDDAMANLSKEQLEQFSVGQKLDIRDLLKIWYGSNLDFGFGNEVWDFEDDEKEDALNSVLETTVTYKERATVYMEYLRFQKTKEGRSLLKETDGQMDTWPQCLPAFCGTLPVSSATPSS